jgi:prevent-host-death family protein
MMEYTYSQARQNLAEVLEQAARDGEVRIRRRDGRVFVLRPQRAAGSPLDVGIVDLGVSTGEIVVLIREGRERYG